MAKRKLLKGTIALSVAAVLCAVGVAMSASADEYKLVKLPGATVADENNDVFWTFGTGEGAHNETISFLPSLEKVDAGEDKAFRFTDISDIKSNLRGIYNGNFCDSYIARFNAESVNYHQDLVCAYDTNTFKTELSLDSEEIHLPETDEYTLTVEEIRHYDIAFDDTIDSDETEAAAWVKVQPQGMEPITIYSETGEFGCMGDETGMQCSVPGLTWDEFSNASFRITEGFDPDTMEVVIVGADGYHQTLAVTAVGDYYEFNLRGSGVNPDFFGVNVAIEPKGGQPDDPDDDGPQPHPGDPTNAVVTVTDRDLSPIAKSFYLGRININWQPIVENEDCEMDSSSCPETYTNDHFVYNLEAGAETVEIDYGSLFIYKYIGGTVKVNNTEYPIGLDYSDRTEWLTHYDHQMVGFTVNVPVADHYDIVVDLDETPGEEIYIANFLWTNDENAKGTDEYIGHSNIELVSILCHVTDNFDEDVLITGEDDVIPDGCIIEYDPGNEEHPVGSLVLPNDSTITVRLKTEYGWQVTSFGANGGEITPDPDKIAEYTFNVHRGNFHLGAIVEPVSDEVNAESNKVKKGTIKLGGDEIEEGTAMLTVGDADLTDEEKDKFREEAGDYNISTFLDIDLDQIFYNGHGGYWKGAAMNELENEATITLQLEEGVDGNEVVLVHKKHDGTYEIIPTNYDPATNTLTFKTSSFSDYAIASKATADKKEDNADAPKTFDEIVRYLVMFTLCGAGIAAVGIVGLRAKADK